jgi:hypothetical protein
MTPDDLVNIRIKCLEIVSQHKTLNLRDIKKEKRQQKVCLTG